VRLDELAQGLWRWTALHPDWTPEQRGPEGWEQEVGSVYCEADGDVVLVDPLVPGEDADRARFWQALDRDLERAGSAPHIVLTCAWHARSSADVLARYPGARLWVAADGLSDLPAGLEATDRFRAGDALPGGAQAFDAAIANEVFVWLPSHGALVAGDTLIGDFAGGVRVCPASWLSSEDPAVVRARLRERLLALPIEHVLVSHGEPGVTNGGEALERALR
jgi:glyoxylase-like metal-dependent hydrolase (beta-lactamase superfamily II)